MKENKGITLVALVVTIIIIIILSTITINMAFGDYSLIKQAIDAKGDAENRVGTDTNEMDSVLSEYTNMLEGEIEGWDHTIYDKVEFGEIVWANGKASITVSTSTNYYIEYQVNGQEKDKWTRIDNHGEIKELIHGDTVYARLTDEVNIGEYASATIIDDIQPKVEIKVQNLMNTSAELVVTASDEESGLAKTGTYTYYLDDVQKVSNETASYNYTGLTAGGTYTLKVIVKDEAGNTTEASIEITTPEAYKVTYYIDSGNVQTQDFITGESVITGLNFTPSKGGYTFVGWREDKTASSSVLTSKTMNASEITLYAVFMQTITVSYNGNGATGGSTASQTGTRYYNNGNSVNPSFTLRSNGFTKTNGKFNVWAMGSANGTRYNAGASVTLSASTTFYARWYTKTTTTQNSSSSISGWYQDSNDVDDSGTFHVTFPTPFAEPPTVTVNCWWTSHQMDRDHYSYGVKNITTTGCDVWISIWETGATNYKFNLDWTATGTLWTGG